MIMAGLRSFFVVRIGFHQNAIARGERTKNDGSIKAIQTLEKTSEIPLYEYSILDRSRNRPLEQTLER